MEDSMEALRRAGVVTLHADVSRAWQAEAGKICEVVRSHQGSRTDYRLVLPLASGQSHAALRKDLIGAAPRLGELVQTVRAHLAGACAVFIPQLGLAAFDDNQRALLAYALAACLGNPTATDTKRVIWDVKARSRDSSYFSTFSETDLEAAFHTDTQYYPAPEQFFLLYCMQPARCGGGLSSICDARALRRDIEATERWIADVLASRLLPFRVPSAFVTTREPDAVQATLAAVFADDPLIRYRRDTLSQGLLHFPECADADAHRALDAFDERLTGCPHTAEFFMQRDSLVVVDNHRALHARTSFQDDERHMLRIRVRTHEPARPEALPRIVTRTRRAVP